MTVARMFNTVSVCFTATFEIKRVLAVSRRDGAKLWVAVRCNGIAFGHAKEGASIRLDSPIVNR